MQIGTLGNYRAEPGFACQSFCRGVANGKRCPEPSQRSGAGGLQCEPSILDRCGELVRQPAGDPELAFAGDSPQLDRGLSGPVSLLAGAGGSDRPH